MGSREESIVQVPIRKVGPGGERVVEDRVVVEEPMEIRLGYGATGARATLSLSITMRTPGDDFDLAAGFLLTEQIIRTSAEILSMEFCGPVPAGRTTGNIVRVELDSGVDVDPGRLQRNFYATSSCGICGKASLDAVELQGLTALDRSRPKVSAEVLHHLPEALRAGQPLFKATGGIHGAGLFSPDGTLLELREDVGRHNAVDKLVGARFLSGRFPVSDAILVVSGRAGFEITQKALAAEIPILVSVGAPSTLSVDLANRFGMTLIGFARANSFNIYAAPERIPSC
jgi:FdhD protein